MKVDILPLKEGEEQQTYELILRVFHKYVAPVYSEDGVTKFLGMLSAKGLIEQNKGEKSFVIVAKDQEKIIGMLSVINESHIALFFVDSSYQGKGIGKTLIYGAIQNCLIKNPELSAVTVSSSPNSNSFYEKIGFEVLGDEINDEGMRFTPMQKCL